MAVIARPQFIGLGSGLRTATPAAIHAAAAAPAGGSINSPAFVNAFNAQAAASAPTAPAPVFTPPPDPGLDAAIAGYGATRDSTLSGLGADRTRTLLDYGFTETPGTGTLAYDARNPFSREALRRLHYDQARQGNTTSYAARGQLYAGSLQNAQNATNFQDQQTANALQNQLGTLLAGNTQNAAQAASSYGTQVGLAQSNSLSNLIANQLKSTG